MAAKDNARWKDVTLETEKLLGDSFVPADGVPNIQVTTNEPTMASSQLRIDEEEEMMRRVLRHLNTPEKDDPTSRPIHGWQLADQSLEAQVAQVVAGNLSALGPDTGDDDVLADVMSTACLSILPPSPQSRIMTRLQPHSCLLMRSNTLHLESHSQTRGQNGIRTRAKQFVPLTE